jgi:hypothetical protein
VKVLIENVKGSAGHWKCKKRADQGDASPLSGGGRKAAPDQGPASQQQKKRRETLAKQFRSGNRDVREANPGGHDPVKHTRLHLPSEQLEVVRIEGRMQASLDRGEIDRVIFDPGVVSFDHERCDAQ